MRQRKELHDGEVPARVHRRRHARDRGGRGPGDGRLGEVVHQPRAGGRRSGQPVLEVADDLPGRRGGARGHALAERLHDHQRGQPRCGRRRWRRAARSWRAAPRSRSSRRSTSCDPPRVGRPGGAARGPGERKRAGAGPPARFCCKNASTRGRHIAHPVTIRPSTGATMEAISLTAPAIEPDPRPIVPDWLGQAASLGWRLLVVVAFGARRPGGGGAPRHGRRVGRPRRGGDRRVRPARGPPAGGRPIEASPRPAW